LRNARKTGECSNWMPGGSRINDMVCASQKYAVIQRMPQGGDMSADARHSAVQSSELPKPAGPYSPAVVFERLVFVSGQGAKDSATGLLAGPDIESQTEQVLKNVAAILEAAGSGLDHVLRCGVFLTDMSEFARMNSIYERAFGANRPARTTVQVAALPSPGLRVEIDAIAYIP